MNRAVASGVIGFGALVVATAQPASDATRVVRTTQAQLYFVPSAAGVRAAASGFEEVAADLFWVRGVLMFGERYDTDDTELWHTWLSNVLDVVSQLDPLWLTPYQYGGGMLRTIGEIEAADLLYERCTERLADVSWCPFSRGMNDLLNRDDPEGAAHWMKIAASRPGAPKWYGAAAAALSSKAGQRHAGLVYLDDQLAITTDEGVRRTLLFQKGRLLHDDLVAKWSEACRGYLAEHGAPLPSPEALAALGFPLPENPRGDAWVVGHDGIVRSAGAEAERRRKARSAEVKLIHR